MTTTLNDREGGTEAAAGGSEGAARNRDPQLGYADEAEIAAIVHADDREPFGFLGIHPDGPDGTMVVRAFLPQASEVEVVDAGSGKVIASLPKVHDEGVFAGPVPGRTSPGTTSQ